MASLKLVKKGGLLLVGFWFTSTILGILQNAIGMGVCSLMGIDKFYGILAGAVALMGGLGTSAAFGPFFEQNYGCHYGRYLRYGNGTHYRRPFRRKAN